MGITLAGSGTCFLLEQNLDFIVKSLSFHLTSFLQIIEPCVCNDIPALFETIGINYDPDDRRLFIDSFKESTKAVLLHNGNIFTSVSVAYLTAQKKTYNTLQFILNRICYEKSKWFVCSELKFIALLKSLQMGCTKYCWFLCFWDSRARSKNYKKEQWLMWLETETSQQKFINVPLVPANKITLPPLHIKLNLFKQFVKALDKNSETLSCTVVTIVLFVLFQKFNSANLFPSLVDCKNKKGVFVGSEIQKLTLNKEFNEMLNTNEQKAQSVLNKFASNF